MDTDRVYRLIEKIMDIVQEQGNFKDDKAFEEFITKKSEMTDSEFRDLYYSNDQKIEKLWLELSDDLFEETEDAYILKGDWHGFAKGTSQALIHDWFDWHHSRNLIWLMENVNNYSTKEAVMI